MPVAARIDTFGFAVPCDDFDRDAFNETINKENPSQWTYRYQRKLPGGGFVSAGVGNAAWLEASAPKRVFEGENWKALPVEDVVEVARDMLTEAESFIQVSAGHRFEDSKVVRVDLVRDFSGVADPTPVLDGLASIDHPGRSKVRRFADPSANRAETLRVGPRAWGATLYDKTTESNGKAPAGQLRFEARLHHDQLTSVFAKQNGGHVARVVDLVRAGGRDGRGDGGRSLAVAQRAWFDRVGFGRAVAGRNELRDRLVESGLSTQVCGSLWSYLTLPGFAQAMSRPTRRKYRRLAVGLGFAPHMFGAGDAPMLAVPTTTSIVRLDYDEGTLRAA